MNARKTFALLVALTAACSPPDPDATTKLASPDLAQFRPLQEAMGSGCGSLDCHGQPGRNLKIYDGRGLRLAPGDLPGVNGDGGTLEGTTPDEVLADMRSLVALEPEVTSQVLKDHGREPDRLMVVRKARGIVEHKGGVVWPPGSHGDKCLTSFFASNVDMDNCTQAVADFTTPPDPPQP